MMNNTCPVCSSNFGNQDFKTIPYATQTREEEKPQLICFCQNCGAGFAFPPLSEVQLQKFYSKGEYWRDPQIRILSVRSHPGQYVLAKARWEFIEPYLKSLRKTENISILDFGAGHGFFGMMGASSPSFRIGHYTAIESDACVRVSLMKTWESKFSSIDIRAAEDLEKIKETYDLIVLSHIVEHVIQPKDFLKSFLKFLRPGGLIFIDVPHADYLYKKDVFPHLLFFNLNSLKKLIEESGLCLISIGCYGRSMKIAANDRGLLEIVEKMVFKSRFILPKSVLTQFFMKYLNADQQNNEGIWIRALAKV